LLAQILLASEKQPERKPQFIAMVACRGFFCAAICLLLGVSSHALVLDSDLDSQANPIRKVVKLLQNMQKEISHEGEKEKELFDKFMCYCSGSDQELKAGAANAKAQIASLTARLKSETSEKTQLAQELVAHANDRSGATKDLEESAALRKKDAGEHASAAGDLRANIAAMGNAIPALQKGLGASALMQMPGSDRLASLLDTFPFQDAQDRRHLLAFVQQNGDYVPQSGQIVGILKNMKDTMEGNLKDALGEEDQSVKSFADLKASKEQEIALATEAIASKTKRSGELAVSLASGQDDVEDTTEELANTQKFLNELGAQCASKQAEWDARQKVRQEEVTAIGEAIGILNDDDALDVFKKAIPSALVQSNSVGFLQQRAGKAQKLQQVQALLSKEARADKSTSLKLLLFTVNSKVRLLQKGAAQSGNFDEVVKMIDDMMALLKKNQADDEKQKDWCGEEFHSSAGEEASAKRKLEKASAEIEELSDAIVATQQEIERLGESIKELDKTVAEATEQRKEEHSEYASHIQMTNAALGLVEKAKNRMNKFYNPTVYKAPPTTTVSPSPYGFVQLEASRHSLRRVAPPEAPETFSGDYQKSGKSGGVVALMKMICKELELDMQDATHDEKAAQKDYTELMNDSSTSRSQDAKSITDKEAAKAGLNTKLTNMNEMKRSTQEELSLVQKYIGTLHAQCDFITGNFDERKEARTTEIDSLQSAKAMLSGAR